MESSSYKYIYIYKYTFIYIAMWIIFDIIIGCKYKN